MLSGRNSSSFEVGMQHLIVAVRLAVLLLCVRCGGGQMPALGHRSASDTCMVAFIHWTSGDRPATMLLQKLQCGNVHVMMHSMRFLQDLLLNPQATTVRTTAMRTAVAVCTETCAQLLGSRSLAPPTPHPHPRQPHLLEVLLLLRGG